MHGLINKLSVADHFPCAISSQMSRKCLAHRRPKGQILLDFRHTGFINLLVVLQQDPEVRLLHAFLMFFVHMDAYIPKDDKISSQYLPEGCYCLCYVY